MKNEKRMKERFIEKSASTYKERKMNDERNEGKWRKKTKWMNNEKKKEK